MNMNVNNYSKSLSCSEKFKRAFRKENGVITIGNIEDLINYKTKYCGWYCRSCGTMVDSEQGYYCPKCGQRFC